ncbi:transglutaminase-like cysteine peptidase [Microvirga massiliensis]|uniref:transglutaminase-like cysteine peptidase n=1 Tax=Microvirga massiliensis TaxID=1033741 RepID=UPI00062B9D3D|nr:transglutaminase-like cysteine peptidase [Microvirga massiliensis]
MPWGDFLRGFISFANCGEFTKKILAAAIAGVGLIGSNPGLAETRASLPPITLAAVTSDPARPTVAWEEFCHRLPSECGIDPSEASTITLSPQVWTTILEVNTRVNQTIEAVTDFDHWGVVDRWDYPADGRGDCEDIQLLKRKLLTEAGLPHRALRMTVVIDELGEGHAVLMARTDRGDFVLDNKRNAVLPWQQTGYYYIKRESSDQAGWVSFKGEDVPVVITATR